MRVLENSENICFTHKRERNIVHGLHHCCLYWAKSELHCEIGHIACSVIREIIFINPIGIIDVKQENILWLK